jgi:hypothetical protein
MVVLVVLSISKGLVSSGLSAMEGQISCDKLLDDVGGGREIRMDES